MRKAGILFPVAALPDRHGCGSFGKEAFRFIDLIAEMGFSIWQILPLNPLGLGNSPYMPYSSYALDDIYLDLDGLAEQGLLDTVPSFHRRAKKVDYAAVRKFREPYLREAYANFKPDLNYVNFSFQDWVRDYALFRTFQKLFPGKSWVEWPLIYKEEPEKNEVLLKPYEEEILYQVWLQYELFLQWKKLKQYANDRDVEIMGDLPFYVGLDSADCWGHKNQFKLSEDGRPSCVAGVPPDYFSATGQRWGNPIYDWDVMEKDGFLFWLSRLTYTRRLYDIVRLDHFRAFDTYWEIPADCPTAIDGRWVEAPGYKLFDALFALEPETRIVAEDLGDLRAQVLELRDHYEFRGMRVLQFDFPPMNGEADKEHLLVYSGTHDNDTTYAWYRSFPAGKQRTMRQYLRKLGYRDSSFMNNLLSYAMFAQADMVIVPLQDWIHLGKGNRYNQPGTSAGNWEWRLVDFSAFGREKDWIHRLLMDCHRTDRLSGV